MSSRRGHILALALASAVLLLLGQGGAALAHAVYVKSNPAEDARLTKPPTEIRVTFSEPPDAKSSQLQVLDADGKRWDKNDVTSVSDEGNTLRVSVDGLIEAGYLVSWTAVSAVDGHETKGAFGFAIGNAPLPKIPDVGESAPPPGPLELVGRALSYGGIALVLGSAIFVLFLRAPADDAERRRERRLVAISGAILTAGSVLLLASSGATIPVRLGALLGVRALAGIVAVAALAVPVRVLSHTLRREVQAGAGVVAALTATLVSHAFAYSNPKEIVLDLVHVLAVSVWVGGVVALLLIVLPTPRSKPADRVALGETVWRFSLTAMTCVAVIVTSGALQSLDRLVLIEDLVETPYGVALLAKIILLGTLMLFGAMNLLIFGPRLRAGLAARSQLLRSTVGETVLFAGVLVAAAFLTALAPPAQASAAAFDQTRRESGLRIELLAAQTIPGRNRYVVRVQQGLASVTGAEKVALRFTMVEHDMGEQELVATERAPGEYVAEGSPTAMFGTWKIQTIVRITGQEDISTVFTVPVGAPTTATGSSAKVFNLPPYTLIVFTDPFSPQAGAPLTINAVITNEKGDPVSGKKVTATFSGPATQPPVQGVENAAQGGPGRYAITLSGLEAGSWKVTVDIGGEVRGDYAIEVAR